MIKTTWFGSLILGAMALSASAATLTQRADIRGNAVDGKCTIEVEVDGAADVEISGDVGHLRTLAGQTAVWRRFVCNGLMPRQPYEFRFRGIDGRGRQTLVRDPRNGGPAVVRIEDSKGGREGYTFDLEWRGGAGGGVGPGPGIPGGIGGGIGGGRPGGGRPGGGRMSAERAIRLCQDAAMARIQGDGYRRVNFERLRVDDRPGRNDWILGNAVGERGRTVDRFEFGCSVDFDSGRVRNVDVKRR